MTGKTFASTKKLLESSAKKQLIEDIVDMEMGIFGNRNRGDSMVAVTRADSHLDPEKQSLEEKIIALNLEKRKTMMKVEARRELIGDDTADNMRQQIEEQYQAKLMNIDI